MSTENQSNNIQENLNIQIDLKTPVKPKTANIYSTPKSTIRPNTSKSTSRNLPWSPNSSTLSVGSTARESAKLAKLLNTQEKINKVKELKIKWNNEKQFKLNNNKLKHDLNIKTIKEQSDILSQQRKNNLEKQIKYNNTMKQIENDMLVAFSKDRIYSSNEMKRLTNERKRQSILLNSEIKLKSKIIEKQLKDENKNFELNLLESKYNNYIDEKLYKQSLVQNKRESLANRLNTWRKEKQVLKEIQENEKENEVNNYVVRKQDWNDIQEYKNKELLKQRESLTNRLIKYKKDKEYDQLQLNEENERKEYENEITKQNFEDIQMYEEKVKQQRRQSLAYRLDKARKDHDYDNGQQAIVQLLDAEEYSLKQQDREDIENYKNKLLEMKRQSLAYRLQNEHQDRLRLQGEKQNELFKQQEDFELNRLVWLDVKTYQENERKKQRESLVNRLIYERKQKEEDMKNHQNKLNELHNEYQLRHNNWVDEINHKEEIKDNEYKSLLLSLESWKIQKLAEEKLLLKKQLINEENIKYHQLDWEDLQTAKKKFELEYKMKSLNSQMVI